MLPDHVLAGISRRQSSAARMAAAKPIPPSAPDKDCATVASRDRRSSNSPAGASSATKPAGLDGKTSTRAPLMEAIQPGTWSQSKTSVCASANRNHSAVPCQSCSNMSTVGEGSRRGMTSPASNRMSNRSASSCPASVLTADTRRGTTAPIENTKNRRGCLKAGR